MRVSFEELESEIRRVLEKCGMQPNKAETCAHIHAETTYDGVYSHGVNRVARFVDYVQKGWVNVNSEPNLQKEFGAIQIYNGNLGPGILNALFATERAMDLANKFGIGMVGLNNTTHWMRAGTYAFQAAAAGYISIMWTNTESCMPPWGGKDCTIGNNPLSIGVPAEREPIVLDMAMSQYSYGKLETTRLAQMRLPVAGGFDRDGNLTDDPALIEESMRILPMGYWKGSALAFVLNILAALLTDGAGTADIDKFGKGSCGGASQVFILIDPQRTIDREPMIETLIKEVTHLKRSRLSTDSSGIFVPGEGRAKARKEHQQNGIPIDDGVWRTIQNL